MIALMVTTFITFGLTPRTSQPSPAGVLVVFVLAVAHVVWQHNRVLAEDRRLEQERRLLEQPD